MNNIMLVIWLLGCIVVAICFAEYWQEDVQLALLAKRSPEVFALTAIVAVVTWPLGLIYLIIESKQNK